MSNFDEKLEKQPLMVNTHPSYSLNHESVYPPIPSSSTLDEEKSPKKYSTLIQWFSIFTMILVTLLDFVLFAIIFPSLLSYIQELDGDETFYSWTLFSYSLCQAIMAPILASLAESRSYREVMFISLGIEVIANILYSLAQNKWMILISRISIGLAAGSSAVSKSYFSAVTTSENRTLVMTLATVAQALGFVAGPGIGTFLSLVNIEIRDTFPRIVFDKHTMAGWFSAALGFVCLLLIVFFLIEPDKSKKRNTSVSKRELDIEMKKIKASLPTSFLSKEEYADLVSQEPSLTQSYQRIQVKMIRKTSPSTVSLFPVFVLLYCWFASTTCFTIFEALAAIIMQDQYNWDVLQMSTMWLSTAVASIFTMAFFMMYTTIGHKLIPKFLMLNDRVMCILSFVFMILGFGIMFSIDGKLPLVRWIIGALVISSSMAVNQTLINSLYSLVLDANNQGAWMGYQTTSGCVARIISPLIAVYIYNKFGDNEIFLVAILMMVLGIILCILSYLWMIPHESHIVKKNEEQSGDDIKHLESEIDQIQEVY